MKNDNEAVFANILTIVRQRMCLIPWTWSSEAHKTNRGSQTQNL